ncbi:hypothetical protein [Kribbella monticola]|uniref:hypothetical protein n=1 Tax=Kribbella monticola TaxID=2185285 RepID=UPI000DD3CF3C|nr:hypothetical protein [Kribbella monticola]
MTANWPQVELDAVRRLRALAAGIPGAVVTERVFDRPLPVVWELMWDDGRSFAEIQPDMHAITDLTVDGDRVSLHARSRYGFRAHLQGTVRPGWCWLQSRFLLIGMAAAEEPGGRTRVALTGGVRIPARAALVPIGVRRESTKSLDRLQELVLRDSAG